MSEDAQPEPGECLACRGTGRVISGLGGTPHDVRCPWCEGTGTRIPGIDAQAHPAETAADVAKTAGADAPGAAGAHASDASSSPDAS